MTDEPASWWDEIERRQNWVNKLFYGDNLEILREKIPAESIDLIYLDPPFNSNRSYSVLFADKHGTGAAHAQIEAFDDTWTWTQEADRVYFDLVQGGAPPQLADALQAMHRVLGENDMLAYLVMMSARLAEMHRVLKQTGALYLHCDPVAVHYLKVLLDAVFGPDLFLNQITWQRTFSHGNVGRNFGSISDYLLVYTKSKAYTWNQQYSAFTPDYIEKTFKFTDDDGRRWQSVTLRNPSPRPNLMYPYTASNGVTYKPHPNGWVCDEKKMKQLDKEDRLHYPAKPTGALRLKMYLDESEGIRLQNIWTDIPPIGAAAQERLGYPTQKPVALLERIIKTSSNPGDVVLDPFCGCGTALVAAQKDGRRWIGMDVAYIAVDLMSKRITDMFGSEAKYEVHGIPRDLPGAQALFEQSHFEFERWAVSLVWGQPKERPGGDQGIDGLIRFPLKDKNDVGRAIVSVKGGTQLNPAMVRDLKGTVERDRAAMGVLITLAKPTRGMVTEAAHSGSYIWPVNGEEYPRLQLISVEDVLNGKRLNMPTPLTPYLQAARHMSVTEQQELFG